MRTYLQVILCSAVVTASLFAQDAQQSRAQRGTIGSLTTLPIPRSIFDAEREGATFPRTSTIDTLRAKDLSTNGTADRRCVTNTLTSSVRSGDFDVGMGKRGLGVGKPNKVPWIPLHDPSLTASGLLVRGARIDSSATPADTLRHVELDYGWPIVRDRPNPGAFFPSSITVPSAGIWLIVATAGNDWGCVTVMAVHDFVR